MSLAAATGAPPIGFAFLDIGRVRRFLCNDWFIHWGNLLLHTRSRRPSKIGLPRHNCGIDAPARWILDKPLALDKLRQRTLGYRRMEFPAALPDRLIDAGKRCGMGKA